MKPTRVLAGFASVSLLVFSLVALLPDRAYACECVGFMGSPQELAKLELEQSRAVFSGEAQDTTDTTKLDEGFPVTFRTIDVWKGPHRDTLEVTTGGMCAYIFEEGREYLVYADNSTNHGLSVGLCGETKPLSQASEEVQALNLVDTSGGVPGLGVIRLAGLAATIAGLLLLRRSLNI